MVRSVRNAPLELISLSNESEDLKLVISEIEGLDRESNLVRKSSETLTKLLITARIKVNELDHFVKSLGLQEPKVKSSKLQRLRWVVAKKRTAQRLQAELRSVRQNLCMLLAARSAIASHSVQVVCDSLSATGAYITARDANILGTGTALTEPSRLISPGDSKEDTESMVISETNHEKFCGQKVQGLLPLAVPIQTDLPKDHGNFALQFHRHRQKTCKSGCTCQCHRQRLIQTPSFLSGLLGKLSAGYSSNVVADARCDMPSCHKEKMLNLRVVYVFPRWLLAKAVSALVSQNQQSVIHFVLSMRHYFNNEAIFTYIRWNNIEEVKRLIMSNKVSPNEREKRQGQTPLHWAVYYNRLNICRLLLDLGADTNVEDDSGRSLINHVSGSILAYSPSSSRELRKLFWKEYCTKDLELPFLHQIVLGIPSGNLEKQLQATGTDVDAQDALGYTAITWAARLKRDWALHLLVQHRANPNIPSFDRKTALEYAARRGLPSSGSILLSRGIGTFSSKDLFCALREAAYRQTDLSFIKQMIEAGCPLESPDGESDFTPLTYAAAGDNANAAMYLIEQGANVDLRDHCGGSPIMHAVTHGSVRVLRVLLEHGADYRMTNDQGYSLIHLVAGNQRPNVDVVEILREAGLEGIDIHAKDQKGGTAIEILRARPDVSERFRKAFYELLRSIKPPDPPVFGPYLESEQVPGAWPGD